MAGAAQWGARLVALLASFAGLATAAAVLPSAARDGAVADIGRRLASRERFAAPDLARMDRPDSAARAARRCDLPVLRGLALIRASRSEQAAAAGDLALVDAVRVDLAVTARDILTCMPREGIAWFILAWLETAREGATPQALGLLAMSYRQAPLEAWVALPRIDMALKHVSAVDEATRAAIVREWRSLLIGGFESFAAQTFARAAAGDQDTLIPALDGVPASNLRWFLRHLENLDATERLPAQYRDRDRPWR